MRKEPATFWQDLAARARELAAADGEPPPPDLERLLQAGVEQAVEALVAHAEAAASWRARQGAYKAIEEFARRRAAEAAATEAAAAERAGRAKREKALKDAVRAAARAAAAGDRVAHVRALSRAAALLRGEDSRWT